jgi:hypothetical protein
LSPYLLTFQVRCVAVNPARIAFPGSVRAVPSDASTGNWHLARARLTREELGEVIDFRISLKMRAFDELQARLHGGQQVSQDEMEANYLPSAADYQRLLA